MKNIDNIYCPNCLEIISETNYDLFSCDNSHCECKYTFKVFKSEQGAITFFGRQESWKPKYMFQMNSSYIVCFHNLPVKKLIINKLSELISKESLRLIELGVSADLSESVTILESDGSRIDNMTIFDGNEINVFCTDYCRLIRTINSGNSKCELYDNEKLNEILNGRYEKYWYYCWAGLIDYFSIISINNIILGIIVSGQIVDTSEKGQNELSNGIDRVVNFLPINKQELTDSLKNIKSVNSQSNINNYIYKLENFAKVISEIADKSYKIQKKINEDLFLDEIGYFLDYSSKGFRNINSIDIVLKRIEEYYSFESVYFLYSPNKLTEPYRIYSHDPELTNLHFDRKIDLALDEYKKTALESVSIYQLNPVKNANLFKELKVLLSSNINHIIYLATCPLIAMNQGVFLFINPKKVKGFRQSTLLGDLEKDFLRRFCVTVRDKLNNNLSFGIVLNRIGHELGNSVQALISNEDAIIDAYNDSAEVKELSKNNIKELIKHAHFISNLKSSLSKSNRNTYIINKRSLKDMFNDIIDVLDKDIKFKNLFINSNFYSNYSIEMDYEELGRAFYNLIQNAVKYSFNNKYINILGKEIRESRTYQISIINYGVGITEEELNLGLIFNEGYRGKLSIDRNRTGSGLGLAVAKEIIENHNGTIRVSSSNVLKDENDIDYYIKIIESEILIDGIQKIGYYTNFTINLPYIQKYIT